MKPSCHTGTLTWGRVQLHFIRKPMTHFNILSRNGETIDCNQAIPTAIELSLNVSIYISFKWNS